ncbi:hypothetical protein AB0H20_01845 [Nocardia fluminea]|uniref:hypothetical protein n=1 Tax=Nocardia fluminea TaxID=134984 RepID=UPI0033DD16B8
MTPWWQPMLAWGGVVIAAIIAGGFAVRNARKTPHENLKTLVEILEKSEHVWRDDRRVLEEAVHREIQRIDQLNRARVEGFWSYLGERSKQILRSPDTFFGIFFGAAYETGALMGRAIAGLAELMVGGTSSRTRPSQTPSERGDGDD